MRNLETLLKEMSENESKGLALEISSEEMELLGGTYFEESSEVTENPEDESKGSTLKISDVEMELLNRSSFEESSEVTENMEDERGKE